MRITYVGYGDFRRYAGMKQLYHFAQEVSRQGHQTQILVAGAVQTVDAMEESPLSDMVSMSFVGPILAKPVVDRVVSFEPDILHVWTARHLPGLVAWQLQRKTRATVILDHEDDERYLRALYLGSQGARYGRRTGRLIRPVARLRARVLPWLSPVRADGSTARMAEDAVVSALLKSLVKVHTAISPALVAHVESTWCQPVHLLFPGANLALFSPDMNGRAVLEAHRLIDRYPILVYSGTLDLAIARYFIEMLKVLVREAPQASLILVGNDDCRKEAEALAGSEGLNDRLVFTGTVPYARVPEYLASADVLLQHPLDIGNRLRLPAKLPEYLAMGKPIVTYGEGIGEILKDGVQVLKLASDSPDEMAGCILRLLHDEALRRTLALGSRALAEELFDWSANGRRLVAIYEQALEQ